MDSYLDLSFSYVINQIKMICKACKPCQTAKVRRQQLSAAFEQADKEDLSPPSIDSYGHTHGDILVAIDPLQESLLFVFFLIGR